MSPSETYTAPYSPCDDVFPCPHYLPPAAERAPRPPLTRSEALRAAKDAAEWFRRDFTYPRVNARCSRINGSPDPTRVLCWVRWRNEHRVMGKWRGVVVLRWWDEKGNATVTTQRAPRADTAATIPTGSTR